MVSFSFCLSLRHRHTTSSSALRGWISCCRVQLSSLAAWWASRKQWEAAWRPHGTAHSTECSHSSGNSQPGHLHDSGQGHHVFIVYSHCSQVCVQKKSEVKLLFSAEGPQLKMYSLLLFTISRNYQQVSVAQGHIWGCMYAPQYDVSTNIVLKFQRLLCSNIVLAEPPCTSFR